MSSNTHCAACGRRLPDDVDGDGMLVFDYMCEECSEAQDRYYEPEYRH